MFTRFCSEIRDAEDGLYGFSYYIVVHSELPCESFLDPRQCSEPSINYSASRTSVSGPLLCLRHTIETPSQRGNLANARLQGLQEDLKLNDTQYATSLSILFAGYIFVGHSRER